MRCGGAIPVLVVKIIRLFTRFGGWLATLSAHACTTKTNGAVITSSPVYALIFSVSNSAVCRIGTMVFLLSVEGVAEIALSIAPETPAMMERFVLIRSLPIAPRR
jgi:hypothetical protein